MRALSQSLSKKLVVTLLMVAFVAAALPACNTTEGAGKDIKSLGKGIEDTAESAK